jgi:hypothetical protein
MKEDMIKDIKAYLVGERATPMIYVEGKHDPTYKAIRDVVMRIYPDKEDNLYDIQQGFLKIITNLAYLEPNDYAKIVNTIKKYEVKGSSNGISGRRTYGYDVSRTDKKMIRRKRGN